MHADLSIGTLITGLGICVVDITKLTDRLAVGSGEANIGTLSAVV